LHDLHKAFTPKVYNHYMRHLPLQLKVPLLHKKLFMFKKKRWKNLGAPAIHTHSKVRVPQLTPAKLLKRWEKPYLIDISQCRRQLPATSRRLSQGNAKVS